jgi:predicted peptidase
MKRIQLGAVVGLLGILALPLRAEDGKTGVQHNEQLDKQITLAVKSKYLLFLPSDYGKDPEKKWPVILFLHGSGERGDNLDLVKLHGPPKIVEQKKDFPFVVISPQCPAGKWWDPTTVVAVLDEVIEKYQVDPDRVYLTGLSMGGFGTWETALAYPDRFAAIAPICGRGNPYRALEIKHIPTWVFHGAKDPAVPISAAEEMVGTLKQAGCDVRFTRYPEAAHDSWTVTYAHRSLYDWFLKHKRGEKPTTAPSKQG